MNTAAPTTARDDSRFLAPLISAFGIVTFLFFIDEGYYNLKWMLDGGAWVVFIIYMSILFPIQFGISEYFLRNVIGKRKLLLMVLVVMPLTIVSLLSVLYLIGS
jgi:hypothetical protein